MQNINYGSGLQNNNTGAGLQNINVVYNVNPSERNPLLLLLDKITGVGATHDAEQQYERGECLPRTREKAIQRILNWIMSPREHPILWLTGAAGVGKTAIAITIAKSYQEHRRLVTSFFFFRADSKRNNPSALFLFIVYGLAMTMPFLRKLIEQRISRDPTILEARMEDQFRELVVKPLTHRQSESASSHQNQSRHKQNIPANPAAGEGEEQTVQPELPYLVIIDGLDECADEQTQKRILFTLQSAFEHSTSFPLRFLICSRPESWLREAFNMPSLQPLHECIVLDESFSPTEDIIRYYNHHFQEIRADPQYSQVKFPTPWPSTGDFETLVKRTDGQFAYAATAVRFIRQAFSQPIEQLQVVLEYTPPRHPEAMPFEQLDALYSVILRVNPHHHEVISILAAIIVLPSGNKESAKSPGFIELVLGLPSGQVALTLRGMHSVLDIHGSDEEIGLFHNSFTEYLFNANRSGSFHIDELTWRHIIARRWLQNLSTLKVRGYSPNQLWDSEINSFYTKWRRFCMSVPNPTQELLDDLQHVDLASACVHKQRPKRWEKMFRNLVRWMLGVKEDETNNEDREGGSDETVTGNYKKTGTTPHLSTGRFAAYRNGQYGVKAPSRKRDKRTDGLDLVETLVHRFENRPRCFHLEWPPGVSPPDDVVSWIVNRAVHCEWNTRLNGSRPSTDNNVRLTDCRCDLSGGNESRDPSHLAYQEACLKLAKDYILLFEELSLSGTEHGHAGGDLGKIFLNLTCSSLLEDCRLDRELLSLCRSFFGRAKRSPILRIRSGLGEEGRKNMLKWLETFPERFAAEAEALKIQLLALPWGQWNQNWAQH